MKGSQGNLYNCSYIKGLNLCHRLLRVCVCLFNQSHCHRWSDQSHLLLQSVGDCTFSQHLTDLVQSISENISKFTFSSSITVSRIKQLMN